MINMSAGVTYNLPIFREVFTIPQAAVQAMDATSKYKLIETNDNFYVLPIACYVYCINQTIPYTGFVHLHLTSSGGSVPNLCAVLTENATTNGIDDVSNKFIYGMVMNVQQPGFFGSENWYRDFFIFFDTLPTAGDGDMVVTLFYTINDLF